MKVGKLLEMSVSRSKQIQERTLSHQACKTFKIAGYRLSTLVRHLSTFGFEAFFLASQSAISGVSKLSTQLLDPPKGLRVTTPRIRERDLFTEILFSRAPHIGWLAPLIRKAMLAST